MVRLLRTERGGYSRIGYVYSVCGLVAGVHGIIGDERLVEVVRGCAVMVVVVVVVYVACVGGKGWVCLSGAV